LTDHRAIPHYMAEVTDSVVKLTTINILDHPRQPYFSYINFSKS